MRTWFVLVVWGRLVCKSLDPRMNHHSQTMSLEVQDDVMFHEDHTSPTKRLPTNPDFARQNAHILANIPSEIAAIGVDISHRGQ